MLFALAFGFFVWGSRFEVEGVRRDRGDGVRDLALCLASGHQPLRAKIEGWGEGFVLR